MLGDVSSDSLAHLVHRECLRFDDDLKCSTTLSRDNLYMCLSCGRCFSSGGKRSPLIEHFFREFHTLVLRMSDLTPVLLPDMTEVTDKAFLSDVIFSAKPHFDSHILELVKDKQKGDQIGFQTLESRNPSPGKVSVIRLLSTIESIRNVFLEHDFEDPLLNEFSRFMKQLFNPFSSRTTLSISNLIRILPDSDDPLFFLGYLLNTINKSLGEPNVLKQFRIGLAIDMAKDQSTDWNRKVSDVWMLPLDIEDSPLYRDGLEKEQVIPRVKIEELTKRYDGQTITASSEKGKVVYRKYEIIRHPQFLILTLNRIRMNEFNKEKSPAHIIFSFERFEFCGVHYRLRAVISHEGAVDTGSYVLFTFNHYSTHWIKCGATTSTVTQEAVAASPCCLLLFERHNSGVSI